MNHHKTRLSRTPTPMRLALLLAACLARADAFATLPSVDTRAPFVTPTFMPKPAFSKSSTLHLSLPSFDLSSSELLSDSDLVRTEFFNGMTHALLDFTAFWGAATVVIRAATVVGRLVVMAQDTSPGHEVLPDELAMQFFLLAVSCHALGSALLPKIQAHMSVPRLMTGQDRRAYRALFRPAGISWAQFKELHLSSMDWVTVEPGQVITSDEAGSDCASDAVYWLDQGDVEIASNGTRIHQITSHNKKEDGDSKPTAAGLRMLGEKRLTSLFDNRAKDNKNNQQQPVTAVAGDMGARLLRMNTTKLEKLLKHNPELTSSVNLLAFQAMQDKLDALLMKTTTSSYSDNNQLTYAFQNTTNLI